MATDVSAVISAQQQFANEWKAIGDGFVNNLIDLARVDYEIPSEFLRYRDPRWTNITDDLDRRFSQLRPSRPAIDVTAPDAPEAPADPTFSTIQPVVVGDFTRAAPAVEIPSAPSSALPSVPSAPAFVDVEIPESPTLNLPAVPTITEIAIPAPPSIALPSFTSTLPIDTLVAPSNTFEFHEQAYSSALLDAAQAKLLGDLENGGYGIEPDDEAALWARAREREQLASANAQDEILRTFAGRGFPVPPGVAIVAVQRAQQDLQDKLSTLSRDIALKRADLYVENRKFTLEQVRQLETTLIGYHNSVMERALNVARAQLEASISVYNAQVSRYNAQLDAYKTEAAVFEAKIRAALSQAEVYRTQMEGTRLGLEAQNQRVNLYRAQLEGLNTVVDIYKTRMEAANTAAGVQRTRMEAFRSQIDAFGAQVQAKVAEFNMFEARVRGETAKLQAFETEVNGYRATVEAAKTRADIQIANLRAEVEQANAHATVYATRVEEFKANLTAQTERAKTLAEVYRADVSWYAAAVQALSDAFRLQLGEDQENVKLNIAGAEMNLKQVMAKIEALKSADLLKLTATKFGGDYVKEIIAAAANSVNTLAAQITSA